MGDITILMLMIVPLSAYADLSTCMNIANLDKKNYCMASYSGSAGFCDKIKSYEYRMTCNRMVIDKQRKLAYQVDKPPSK